MKTSQVFFVSALLWVALFNESKASHIRGGQITAEAVSGQSFTYQITFTLYAGSGWSGGYEIRVGVGHPIEVDSDTFKREFITEDSLFQKVTFTVTHTYPGPGEYLLSYREFNRNHDIVNMLSSVTTPFYMETKLIIDPLSGNNSTPVLSDPINFDAHVKTRYVQNIGATDPDGDSLSYELVTPKQDKELYVEGYYFPHRLGISSAVPPAREDGTLPALLDFENGQLIWNAPAYGGEYTIAFQVKEWRQVEGVWQEIGYITRDFNVLVQDTIHHTHGSQYITGTHDEVERQEVILYPNPTEGQFHLRINDLWGNSQLTVLDITGKIVYQAAVTQGEVILELPHLSSGLYMLTLQKGFNKRSFTLVKH